MANHRVQRLAGELQKEIAAILDREIKDPRLDMISVVSVEIAPDGCSAHIHVSSMQPEGADKSSLTPAGLVAYVQTYAEAHGYGVIRDLCGHGIGTEMHEDPNVPNYGRPGRGVRLQAGMTITIEPMIAMGTWKVYQEDDGWTIVTRDGKPCSHYEHTLLITDGEPELLSWPGKKVSEVLK